MPNYPICFVEVFSVGVGRCKQRPPRLEIGIAGLSRAQLLGIESPCNSATPFLRKRISYDFYLMLYAFHDGLDCGKHDGSTFDLLLTLSFVSSTASTRAAFNSERTISSRRVIEWECGMGNDCWGGSERT